MAEHWDGSEWSVLSVPDGKILKRPVPTYLTGVSCVSAEDCWAAGNYDLTLGSSEFIYPLFEHWNGTTWSATTTGDGYEGGDGLTGITCVSSSDCWAVGSLNTGTGDSTDQTLAERWNGTRWSTVTSANISTSSTDQLVGVTCTSSTNCWAVGNAAGYHSSPSPALTEHWDGSTWSIVPSDQVSTKDTDWLSSVTCIGPTDCWSVGWSLGSATAQGLVEWLARRTSIAISPGSGPPGARITVWGVGFAFGKPVTVAYQSDVSGKAVETNLDCNTSTTVNGVFSCKVSIPVRNAGLLGPHTVTASSGSATASTHFDLT